MLPSDKEQQEINELAQQFERATGAQAVAAVVGKADAYPDIQQPDLSLTERLLFGAFIFGIIGLFTVIGVTTPGMG